MLRIGLGIAASYYALGKASSVAPSPPTPPPPPPPPPTPSPLAYNFTVYSECAIYGTPITIYSNNSSLVYGGYYYADIYGLTPLNGVTYYGGNTPGTHGRYVFGGFGFPGQLTSIENSCTIDPPPPPPPTPPPTPPPSPTP